MEKFSSGIMKVDAGLIIAVIFAIGAVFVFGIPDVGYLLGIVFLIPMISYIYLTIAVRKLKAKT